MSISLLLSSQLAIWPIALACQMLQEMSAIQLIECGKPSELSWNQSFKFGCYDQWRRCLRLMALFVLLFQHTSSLVCMCGHQTNHLFSLPSLSLSLCFTIIWSFLAGSRLEILKSQPEEEEVDEEEEGEKELKSLSLDWSWLRCTAGQRDVCVHAIEPNWVRHFQDRQMDIKEKEEICSIQPTC